MEKFMALPEAEKLKNPHYKACKDHVLYQMTYGGNPLTTDTFELNTSHQEDKAALTLGQLTALKNAKFTDISWAGNECASFGSPCQNYELFVNLRTDNACDEFQIFCYDPDGTSTSLGGHSDLTKAIQAIKEHSCV